MKAYLLKESLERLWNYIYEGAMLRYLKSWIDCNCGGSGWTAFEKLAHMLIDHLEGILKLLPHQSIASELWKRSTATSRPY